jgi:hypothetical protein
LNAATANSKNQLKPFALGTSLYPTPISGLGGPLVFSLGGVSTLTPIPKTGFLGRLRFNVTGKITFSTAASSTYTVPLWRIIQNYTLQNSLNYPYRSLNSDDIWFSQQITTAFAGNDPVVNSNTWVAPSPTSTTANQSFSFTFVDELWNNDGVNFSRYLLSAMTTSNDLTINIQWCTTYAGLQLNGAVVSALSAAIQVSAEYLTVPDPTKYQWPRRNLVQQMLGDPSYNTATAGLNAVNLTPIQGPEFLGLGIQVLNAGVPDTLVPATSNIVQIAILVNGTIPLYTFTLSDMLSRYERSLRRYPGYGYLFINFMDDLGLVNSMSHTHRKVLSTAKYSQITVQVTLGSGFSGGAGSVINLFKRTQQMYASNT